MNRLLFCCFVIAGCLLLGTSRVCAQIQVTHFQEHEVKKGETAATIATKYHLDLNDFLLLNDFPEDIKLNPGTVVLIREIKGEEINLNDTTEDVHVSGYRPTKPIIDLAPPPVPVKKEEPKASTKQIEYGPHGTVYHVSTNGYHVVEKNQTCYRIALIYGLNLDYLQELNNLSNYTIKVGQRLRVRRD